MQDVVPFSLECSSEDVRLTSVHVLQVFDGCSGLGDTATVQLAVDVDVTSDFRYDLGFFIATDGGNARSGVCYREYLPPPLLPSPSPSDLASGFGPYLDADADACGDGRQSAVGGEIVRVVTGPTDPASPATITLACADNDGDGTLDIAFCAGWKNSAKGVCEGIEGSGLPETPAKCKCGIIDIDPVIIVPTPTPTPVPTPTTTPTAAPTGTPDPTPTVTPSPTPTATAAPTATPAPSGTPGPTPTIDPTPPPAITPTPDPVDPDVCNHACASKLLALPGLDREFFQVSLVPGDGLDPATEPFVLKLRNALGTVWGASLPAGSLRRAGTGWTFRSSSRRTEGISQVRLQWGVGNGNGRVLRLFVKAHDELVGATEPEMTLEISVGGERFAASGTWKRLRRGGWMIPRLVAWPNS